MLQVLLLGALSLPVVVYLLSAFIMDPRKTIARMRRMKYQLDVALAINMLTPNEVLVFHTILFLGLSLVVFATVLYLPEHLSIVYGRAVYYFFGSPLYLTASSAASSISKEGLRSTIHGAFQQSNSSLGDKLAAYSIGVRNALATPGLAMEEVRNFVGGVVGYAALNGAATASAQAPPAESTMPVSSAQPLHAA